MQRCVCACVCTCLCTERGEETCLLSATPCPCWSRLWPQRSHRVGLCILNNWAIYRTSTSLGVQGSIGSWFNFCEKLTNEKPMPRQFAWYSVWKLMPLWMCLLVASLPSALTSRLLFSTFPPPRPRNSLPTQTYIHTSLVAQMMDLGKNTCSFLLYQVWAYFTFLYYKYYLDWVLVLERSLKKWWNRNERRWESFWQNDFTFAFWS